MINLGNTHTVTLAEMIEGLERVLGVRAVLERLPEQPGDVPRTWASIDKARALLGYAPATDYEQGVRLFADWLAGTPKRG
ncbi:hypothetical protein D3C83_97210 [compost metagenome]